MYIAVLPAYVNRKGGGDIAIAKPKSATHGVPSALIKTFSGLRSRCSTLRECNIAIPSQIPLLLMFGEIQNKYILIHVE